MGKLLYFVVVTGWTAWCWYWWWKKQDLAEKRSTFRLLSVPAFLWIIFLFYMKVFSDEPRVIFESVSATWIVFIASAAGIAWVVMGMGVHLWLHLYPIFITLTGGEEIEEPKPEQQPDNLEDRIQKMIDDSKK